MRKQLEDFLIDLTEFYPIPNTKNFDKIISQSVDYLLQFCINKEFDFKKVRNAIFDRYKFKGFPDLALIKECLREGEVYKYKNCKDEGCLVVLRLPQGRIYSFEVATFGRSLEELKKDAATKFGNAKVEIYPCGSKLIGNRVMRGD